MNAQELVVLITFHMPISSHSFCDDDDVNNNLELMSDNELGIKTS